MILLSLLLLACGRDPRLVSTLVPTAPRVDAGHLPVKNACTVPFGGPDCCSSAGQRTGSASCVDNAYVCSSGAVCACNGQPQTFHCTDFCGSDAYVAPTCGAAGWLCPSGLIATDTCPPGTCFGDPGGACDAPQCVDGKWVCDGDDAGTRDPPN